MRKSIFIFISLMTSAFLHAQDMYIILLAGQSNMAGRGVYSQLTPQDTVTYSNILSLNKDSVWVRAKHPLHWDKAEASVGMGIQFAHQLALKMGGNVKIGLVPCAAGGTCIDQWNNNAYFGYTGNFYLYTNLIKRAKRAAQSGKILGMIWHQGESDATNALYTTYQDKLKNLFVKIRTDLKMPTMPIVAGELGTYLATNPCCPRWDSINAQINRLKNVLPYYTVVSSSGLSPNSDNTHFTAASQITLGSRYAKAFYALATATSIVQNPQMQQVKVIIKENSSQMYMNSDYIAKMKIYTTLGRVIKSADITEQER